MDVCCMYTRTQVQEKKNNIFFHFSYFAPYCYYAIITSSSSTTGTRNADNSFLPHHADSATPLHPFFSLSFNSSPPPFIKMKLCQHSHLKLIIFERYFSKFVLSSLIKSRLESF